MRLRPNVEWPKQDTQSESLININIGNVGQGSVIGKGALIRADNIAGRDITISEQFLEKKDDFKGELKELRQQIEVILSEEQLLSKPSLLMLENLQDIIEHASSSAPNARWIILRLEDTRRILKESFSVSGVSPATIQGLENSLETVEQLIMLSEKAFSSNG